MKYIMLLWPHSNVRYQNETLKLAQSLYDHWKALTYPRTDSRYLPMDMLSRLPQPLNDDAVEAVAAE